MTVVEKVRSQVAAIEKELAALAKRQSDTTEQRAKLEGKRRDAQLQLAGGNESSRAELDRHEVAVRRCEQDTAAYAVSQQELETKLAAAKKALAHAVEEQDISELESQIEALPALDRELQDALQVVAQKSRGLTEVVERVGGKLAERDERKFANTAASLSAGIRRSIFRAFENMNKPNAPARQTFSEEFLPQLRSLISTLRFVSNGRRQAAQRGEKTYVVKVACGTHELPDLRPNDVIALRPSDEATAQLLAGGTIVELVA